MKFFTYVFVALLLLFHTSCKTSAPATVEKSSDAGPRMLLQDALDGRAAQRYIDACTEMIKGDYTLAIQGFKEVLEANPSYHAASYNIARMSLAQRNYADAITYGKEALSGDPNNYWYYKTLQRSFESSGDYAQSIITQEALSQKFSDKPQEGLLLAKLYRRNEQDKKALQTLRELEEKNGGSRDIWLEKLNILEKNRDWSEGLKVVQKLANSFPGEGQFIEKQYDFLSQLGRADEGVDLLEELLEIDPDNGFAALKLADHYKNVGQIEESDKYLFQAFKNPAIDPQGKLDLITQLLQFASTQGGEVIPRAKRLAAIFQQTHPGSAKADLLEGKIYAFEQKLDSARQKYISGLKSSSTDINLWYEVLEIDLKMGEFQWMFADAEEGLTYYPNQKRILYFYGLGAALREKWEEANYALKKAERLSSEDDPMYDEIKLARQYADWEQGKLGADRENSFTDELKKSSNSLHSLFLAKYQIGKNATSDAEKLLKRIYKQDGQLFVELVAIAIEKGDLTGAETYLQEVSKKGQSPTFLEAWGDLHYKQGQVDQAEKKWKQAIDQGALDLNIKKKLNQ